MKRRLLLSCLLLSGNIALAVALPADIETFIKSRDICDHFRGEPWDDGNDPEIKARRDAIFRNIELHCAGTDRALARLRHKYSGNRPIIQRLSDYDDRIEAAPAR
jgi:hypothetical protein